MRRIRDFWMTISLKKKLGSFSAMLILVMILSVAFSIQVMNFSLDGFNEILNYNSRCHDFQEAMSLEIRAFENYIHSRVEENKEQLLLACVRSERCLNSLPFDYEKIGKERYARTWNIMNGYEGYREARDQVLTMNVMEEQFVSSLYRVYDMQEYLEAYAMRLMQLTLGESNAQYQEKVPVFYNMPYLILLFSIVLMIVMMGLTRVLSNTLIQPLEKMAQSSRRIAKNDFSEPDLVIENRDEMGELVSAFNKMRRSTKGYIDTLKEKNEIAELLHQEELEKIEMEQRLETTRLELLKNQINPHFLFNTLNTIACMAKLEDADTTEKMITSMSNLFRYNLKTSEQVVSLERELKVVQDYMYIQQMRFGSRIRYESLIEVDAAKVMIPAFTLQPVVENAIIHGISKKEQGGKIVLRARKNADKCLVITVADTGLGMDEERLCQLMEAMKEKRTAKVGIGLGNIYKRVHTMYPTGRVEIHSKPDRGCVIVMVIPQEEND